MVFFFYNMIRYYIYIAAIFLLFTGCTSDENTGYVTIPPVSQVTVDLSRVPYATLSEYHFFDEKLSGLIPSSGVIPYEPISSLFSNYAQKLRFVWLPSGTMGTYNGDANNIELPLGSVIIKNFFYDNVLPDNTRVLLETRLMIRKAEGWTFAEYFWNDEQTEAFLDTKGDGGFKYVRWIEAGEQREINYRMPSGSECFTCHKSNTTNEPIGIKPQNLNSSYAFADGLQNQLQKWIDVGYLEDNIPTNINTVVDYRDTSHPLEIRVRSYVDINCASCHRDEGHCNYRPMRFAFSENNLLENLGVCVTPDQTLSNLSSDQKLIKPGDPENSVIYYRLNAIAEDERMPLLGRNIVHDDGVALLRDWITSLDTPCE
ncbi:MAG: putative repeat protein (TIGR03806 family) [Patiriisocius sp.]|jgi:uncharacterized repeat protein (TIGR03806 family)